MFAGAVPAQHVLRVAGLWRNLQTRRGQKRIGLAPVSELLVSEPGRESVASGRGRMEKAYREIARRQELEKKAADLLNQKGL